MISFLTLEIEKTIYFNAKKVGEVLIFMASVHHFLDNPGSSMESSQWRVFFERFPPRMLKHIQTTWISTTDHIGLDYLSDVVLCYDVSFAYSPSNTIIIYTQPFSAETLTHSVPCHGSIEPRIKVGSIYGPYKSPGISAGKL